MSRTVYSSLPPIYSSALQAISPERLSPYLRVAKGDYLQALALYHWNMRVSAALYETLHIVEIALRNAVDQQLRAWNKEQTVGGKSLSPDWLLEPAPLLERLVKRDKILEAKTQAKKHIRKRAQGAQPTHSDVLAQMMFGSWRFLLKAPQGKKPDAGSVLLWKDVFPAAFPEMLLANRTPQDLVDDIVQVYEARNRVAHLEPMLSRRRVSEIRDSAKRILADIDKHLPAWFSSQEQITVLLGTHPIYPIP